MDTRPRVICGFPGVGKTTLFKQLKDQGVLISDSDSSLFPKDDFPRNYIEHIKGLLAQGFWVLCSTHTVVRQALADAGISYALAAPAHKYLKDEYMQRYRERGSPEAFLKLMDAKWDEFMDDVWVNDKVGVHIGLGEGEYLERIAKDIIKSDQGMKHRVVGEAARRVNGAAYKLRTGQPYFSTEHMNGFQAGQIWAELTDALQSEKGWTDPSEKCIHFVRADNQRIFTDMAAALGLDLDVKQTMNPQTIQLTFTPRPVVAA